MFLVISSSTSGHQGFSNSTRPLTSSSSSSPHGYLTLLGLQSQHSKTTATTTSSTSTTYSQSSFTQSTIPTVTGNPDGIPGIAPIPPAAAATSLLGPVSDQSSAPSTPVVVGSVVASVAGASILIFVLLLVVRWWKRNQSRVSLGEGGAIGDGRESAPGGAPSGGMVERRRSLAHVVPDALAGMIGYKKSQQRAETDQPFSSAAGSERGFYRVSGRKLPSVLHSGGDGYGGGYGAGNTLSGSSFYKDSPGLYDGTGGPSSPTIGITIERDSGVPIMRPGPARTPVTEPGPFASMVPAPLNLPPRRPDALGRSRSSQDSSQPSRFRELV
jgi:hypothetical protein